MEYETNFLLNAKNSTAQKMSQIDFKRDRFPFCIVWTPIPVLTWLCPLIGHMGIALSNGVIRDFAGPYYVSEDSMAFGRPVKFWQLNPPSIQLWDQSVLDASEVYKTRMHNLCCDNCHSHVAMALELMNYKNQKWNMVKLALLIFLNGKYVSLTGWLKTWVPFLIICLTLFIFIFVLPNKDKFTLFSDK